MKATDWINIGIAVAGFALLRNFTRTQIDIEPIEVNEGGLSYPAGQYQVFADILFQAIWEFWSFSIDEDAIIETMTAMQTDDDVAQLLNVYGARCKPSLTCVKETLFDSLNRYLTPDEKQVINTDFAAKGISFLVV